MSKLFESDFDKIRAFINKNNFEKAVEKIAEDLYKTLKLTEEHVKNKQYLNKEKKNAYNLAVKVCKMAMAIEFASDGKGITAIAKKIRVGKQTIHSWLQKGEAAILEVEDNEDDYENGYLSHEDNMFIDFYFEFESAKDEKNEIVEQRLFNASEDVTDAEGNIIMKGSYKAAIEWLKIKNKEEYAPDKEEEAGVGNANYGVIQIYSPQIPENLNKEEEAQYLEDLTKNTQKDFTKYIEKKSDEV